MSVSLRTERLLLRPWRDDDIAAFATMSSDPAVVEFLRPFPDLAACEAWVMRARAHWSTYGFGQWVVEVPGEAAFIGVVGLAQISYAAHFTPAIEVAWRLARAYWGRGYATEAARAALITASANSVLNRSSLSPCRPICGRAGLWSGSA